jgi:hypothetical protein
LETDHKPLQSIQLALLTTVLFDPLLL